VKQPLQPASHQGDAQAVESWLTMADGQPIFVRDWPLAQARGAVLIVHGLSEHGGRYAELAQWLNARGYAVRSYDQRGHGKTPGRRGALRHADDLLEDLTAIHRDYAHALGRVPLVLGHSMGGVVVTRSVLDGRIAPGAVILSSPALRSWEPRWRRALARVLTRVTPNLPLRSGLSFGRTSHDPARVDAYRADPLRHGWITPRLADFIFRAGASSIADAARLHVPTLLLVSGSDALVDPSGSSDFSRAATAGGQLTTRFFSMLYHELFNEAEPGRSQVLHQLGDWLQRQVTDRQ